MRIESKKLQEMVDNGIGSQFIIPLWIMDKFECGKITMKELVVYLIDSNHDNLSDREIREILHISQKTLDCCRRFCKKEELPELF